ncbi:hypothetical protein ACNKHL_02455 [Shigella flexneri]
MNKTDGAARLALGYRSRSGASGADRRWKSASQKRSVSLERLPLQRCSKKKWSPRRRRWKSAGTWKTLELAAKLAAEAIERDAWAAQVSRLSLPNWSNRWP